MGIQAIRLILQDRLGLTETRTPAYFPHQMYFFTTIYRLMILSLFSTISITLLSTFSCSWTSGTSFLLSDDSNLICFETEHNIYVIISLIAIITYYPLSSYTFPNFQFADKILDLKYKPSYLILYFQVHFLLVAGKMLLTRINTEFTFQILLISLVITILLLLFLSVIWLKPCLIAWFNLVELWIIGLGLIVNIMGLILYLTKAWEVCVIIVSCLCFVFTLAIFIIIKKRYFSSGSIFN